MFHSLTPLWHSLAPYTHLTLDQVDKGTKIVAVILGGIWTYLNYVRGRTFKRRLEPKISGKIVPSGTPGNWMVSGTAQTKNVGLSKVDIEASGTAIVTADLVLGKSKRGYPKIVETNIPGGVLGVFERHRWIEPGETIDEAFAVPLPQLETRTGVRLRLRIVSRHWLFKNIEWNADSIAELPPPVVLAAPAQVQQAVVAPVAGQEIKPVPAQKLNAVAEITSQAVAKESAKITETLKPTEAVR